MDIDKAMYTGYGIAINNGGMAMQYQDLPGVAGVYRITNVVNGKCYIGISNNIKNRIASHRHFLKKGNCSKKLQRAYKKYGLDSFQVDVLDIMDGASRHELIEREAQRIVENDSVANGYNIVQVAREAEFGEEFSAAVKAALKKPGVKEKIGRISREKWAELSPDERKERLVSGIHRPDVLNKTAEEAAARMRDPAFRASFEEKWLAAVRSGEHRQKQSEIVSGLWNQESYRARNQASKDAIWNDEKKRAEQIEKIRAGMSEEGKKAGLKKIAELRKEDSEFAEKMRAIGAANCDKARTARWADPEQRKAQSERFAGGKSANAKKVRCVETGKIYAAMTEAAFDVSGKKSTVANITRAIKTGSRCHGYHWEYV